MNINDCGSVMECFLKIGRGFLRQKTLAWEGRGL